MIIIENTAAMPQARGLMLLTIQSETDVPSVFLTAEEVRFEERGEWKTSSTEGKQVVSTYVAGKPFKLASAKLPLPYIISGPVVDAGSEKTRTPVSAWKVIVEVESRIDRTSAFEKGDKSRDFCVVTLVRVVEVWGSPTKMLWSEKPASNGLARGQATLDAGGRIVKQEVGAK